MEELVCNSEVLENSIDGNLGVDLSDVRDVSRAQHSSDEEVGVLKRLNLRLWHFLYMRMGDCGVSYGRC